MYSIVSVNFPHCRIQLDGHIFVCMKLPGGSGTTSCQYYKTDVEEAVLPSSYEQFEIVLNEPASYNNDVVSTFFFNVHL